MKRVHSLDELWVYPLTLQFVVNVNSLDDQNPAIELDLTRDLTGEPATACVYLARLQRAPEGPCQSPTCSGNNIVERGGIGRRIPGISPVMLGHL